MNEKVKDCTEYNLANTTVKKILLKVSNDEENGKTEMAAGVKKWERWRKKKNGDI